MTRSDTVTLYVRKKRTGAVWWSPRAGLWQKLSLGNKCHKTKPVGYSTSQFNPNSDKNVHRFEAVSESEVGFLCLEW